MSVEPLDRFFLTGEIADVSTAGQIYIPAPSDGAITLVQSCINGAISGADADLTVKINGTAVTGGTITIAQSGSAAGGVDSCTPSALNYVKQGDNIEIETDGASTGTVRAGVTVTISRARAS